MILYLGNPQDESEGGAGVEDVNRLECVRIVL